MTKHRHRHGHRHRHTQTHTDTHTLEESRAPVRGLCSQTQTHTHTHTHTHTLEESRAPVHGLCSHQFGGSPTPLCQASTALAPWGLPPSPCRSNLSPVPSLISGVSSFASCLKSWLGWMVLVTCWVPGFWRLPFPLAVLSAGCSSVIFT